MEVLVAFGEKLCSGNMLASPYTGAIGPLDANGLRDHVLERLSTGGESGGSTVSLGSIGMRI